MRPKTKPRKYHHGDLQRALIQAALTIITTKGVHALSVREAAKLAGVSSAAPYRHFPTKDSLVAAAALEGHRMIASRLKEAVEKYPDDTERQLLEAAKAYIHFALRHPAYLRIMFCLPDPAQYPEVQAVHQESEETFMEIIRQGQRNGYLAPGSIQDLAVVGLSFIHGFSSLMLEEHFTRCHRVDEDLDVWIRRLGGIILNGLRAKNPPVPRRPRRAGSRQDGRRPPRNER